jgi:hypothetical protein
MRKILLITFLALFCYTVKSQVLISILLGDKLNSGKIEFGLDGGLNLSTINGLDQGKYANLFNLGFYFDIKTKNPHWLVHTGVIVKSTMGMDHLPIYSLNNDTLDAAFSKGSVDRKISYFNVPIMMKYMFGNHFFAEAGPMLGLRYNKCYDTFNEQIKEKDDLSYKLKNSDNYKRIDAGMMGGIGYRLLGGNGMNLGVRYYLGLMNISTDSSSPKMYNRSIYFVVGIPIGAGKAAKKKE